MSQYVIAETPMPDGTTRLTWAKDGKYDPLNFWYVPPSIRLEDAKARIRAGEFDGSEFSGRERVCG